MYTQSNRVAVKVPLLMRVHLIIVALSGLPEKPGGPSFRKEFRVNSPYFKR
jgi:hypothetical protein